LKKALIIFLRYPEIGECKTRLAASIGDSNSLEVYKELLYHTNLITNYLKNDIFLFYNKKNTKILPWNKDIYQVAYQSEGDLGTKMNNAFQQLFDKGYQHLVIIGSDCYELTQNIIEQAFIDLEEYKVAIGPAKDGGYYLLGLSQNTPELFENIAWSTNKVYQSTIEILHKLGINYSVGPILSDIDTVDDLTDKLKLLIK
jgi:uncharacterized protein